jgi:hypothetical protein
MTKLFLLPIILISLSSLGQSNDKNLNVSIWMPSGWFAGDKKLLQDNLTNYKFSKEELNRIENDINASKVLSINYKYDPKTHYGLVPTIKSYIRQNNTKNFETFFVLIKNEIEKVKSQVLNFEYIDTPKTIIVGQRKAFYAISTYNLKVQTGEVATIRTKFIAIPIGKTYLYLTLIDNKDEDCYDVYEKVISKIKIE